MNTISQTLKIDETTVKKYEAAAAALREHYGPDSAPDAKELMAMMLSTVPDSESIQIHYHRVIIAALGGPCDEQPEMEDLIPEAPATTGTPSN